MIDSYPHDHSCPNLDPKHSPTKISSPIPFDLQNNAQQNDKYE